jgi:type VI secretion system FHA domain protein
MTPLRFRVMAAPAGAAAPPLPTIAGAGTIGRSEGNTLVLPDPGALLSRQHCRLEPTGAGWQVVDLSSNGTFVNDMLIGRGNVRPLAIEPDPLDPFGVGDISRAQPAAPVAAPLPPRIGAQDPIFGAAADPFGGAAANPFAPGADTASDPFAMPPQGGFGGPPGGGFGSGPMPAPSLPQGPPLPDVPSALSGGMEEMSVPLPMPAGAQPGAGLPDDWLDEALSGLGPKPEMAPPPPPPPVAPAASLPVMQAMPQAEPVARSAPAAPHAVPTAPVPVAGNADAGLAAFAQGAGISPPAGLAAEAGLVELGRSNRLLARALMRLLAARRAVKSEFRISQTVVAATENNPLKFSADEAELVTLLLGVSRPGFQSGAAAVADAARDLQAHQVALLAAFRAVVGQILARLDPQAIGGKDDDAGFLGRLTGSAKGAAWDRYVQAHADLKQDFSESLRGRLAQVFAEAYEAESRRHGGS